MFTSQLHYSQFGQKVSSLNHIHFLKWVKNNLKRHKLNPFQKAREIRQEIEQEEQH